jgi:hypothetical protein
MQIRIGWLLFFYDNKVFIMTITINIVHQSLSIFFFLMIKENLLTAHIHVCTSDQM